jgi:hypothetical protein
VRRGRVITLRVVDRRRRVIALLVFASNSGALRRTVVRDPSTRPCSRIVDSFGIVAVNAAASIPLIITVAMDDAGHNLVSWQLALNYSVAWRRLTRPTCATTSVGLATAVSGEESASVLLPCATGGLLFLDVLYGSANVTLLLSDSIILNRRHVASCPTPVVIDIDAATGYVRI